MLSKMFKKTPKNVPEVWTIFVLTIFGYFCGFWVLNGPLMSLKHPSEGYNVAEASLRIPIHSGGGDSMGWCSWALIAERKLNAKPMKFNERCIHKSMQNRCSKGDVKIIQNKQQANVTWCKLTAMLKSWKLKFLKRCDFNRFENQYLFHFLLPELPQTTPFRQRKWPSKMNIWRRMSNKGKGDAQVWQRSNQYH